MMTATLTLQRCRAPGVALRGIGKMFVRASSTRITSFSTDIQEQPRDVQSTFENYSETSKNYDKTRFPLGIAASMGAFAMNEIPLHKQKFLDVGGGTGTFMEHVHGKFAEATLFEANQGQLDQALARLGQASGVNLVKGSAHELPFADNTFDAVTINQVIHHFPTEDRYDYLADVLKEVHRVIAPGGAFVLNHSSTEQHQKGYWWFHFMPKAAAEYCRRSPPMPIVVEYLKAAGFTVDHGETYVPLDGILMRDEYMKYGLEAAFMDWYRDGDSGWAVGASTGEVDLLQKEVRALQAAGKEKAKIEELEALRKTVGQATFLTARKPL